MNSLWFIYLFLARLILTYVATLSVSIAAIRTTKSLRLAFLEHTLRQEVWYFDKQGNGAIASQVITNGNKINSAIAEKLSIFIQSVATFVAAFAVALVTQWKLTLIIMGIIPAILLVIGGSIALDAPVEARIMKIYSAAAGTYSQTSNYRFHIVLSRKTSLKSRYLTRWLTAQHLPVVEMLTSN